MGRGRNHFREAFDMDECERFFERQHQRDALEARRRVGRMKLGREDRKHRRSRRQTGPDQAVVVNVGRVGRLLALV